MDKQVLEDLQIDKKKELIILFPVYKTRVDI